MEKHISLSNLKTLLEPIKALLDKKAALDDVKPIPPDLNAAEGEPGHVLNRTHWVERGVIEILPETVPVGEGEMAITTAPSAYPVENDTYTIMYNGVDYECVCHIADMGGVSAFAFGNLSALGLPFETSDPFILIIFSPETVAEMGAYGVFAPLDGSTSVTVSIKGEGEVVHKLDPKFYNPSDFNALEDEPGHILNKPFGKVYEDVFPETVVEFVQYEELGFDIATFGLNTPLAPNTKYRVFYDGVEYECVSDPEGDGLGNSGALGGGDDTGEPFVMARLAENLYGLVPLDGRVAGDTVSFRIVGVSYNKLPLEYMEERETMELSFDVNGTMVHITDAESTSISMDYVVKNLYGTNSSALKRTLFDRFKKGEPFITNVPVTLSSYTDPITGAVTTDWRSAQWVIRATLQEKRWQNDDINASYIYHAKIGAKAEVFFEVRFNLENSIESYINMRAHVCS